jgi:hypothetical protein
MSEKKTRRVACAICGEPVDVPIELFEHTLKSGSRQKGKRHKYDKFYCETHFEMGMNRDLENENNEDK